MKDDFKILKDGFHLLGMSILEEWFQGLWPREVLGCSGRCCRQY